jgi:subtilase family serine protease
MGARRERTDCIGGYDGTRRLVRTATCVGFSLALAGIVAPRTGIAAPGHAVSPTIGAGHMHPAANHTHFQPAVLDKSSGFQCQRPSAQFHCYGPAQIRNAYTIQPLINAGRNGSGEVITIIDAFQNPTMASDLRSFDSTFHLPAPPRFDTIAPFGLTPFDPNNSNQVGWAGEIALDVEWAHAVAPGAKIVLALSPSDADSDIVATEGYVIKHKIGNVISMSIGEAEQCMDPTLQQEQHAAFDAANDNGVTLFAASGDEGVAQFNSSVSGGPPCTAGGAFIKAASTPASDPDVTGVGGTQLKADLKSGAYHSESVWNDPANSGVGGGGFSGIYARPSFQNGVEGVGSMRGVPDVAYSAAYDGGVLVAFGSSGSSTEYWNFYGTSVGTPQWAAIAAIADQGAEHPLGNINSRLYQLGMGERESAAVFHDIVVGNNSFPPFTGYRARPGWDAASGWGSPIAARLVDALSGR